MGSKFKYIKNNRDQIILWFNEGIPATEICTRLGIRKLCTLKSHCLKLGIEWKIRMGWSPNKKILSLGSLDAAIANGSRKETIKKYLLLERGHKCECCNSTLWLDSPIPLEIHHINGNPHNNDRDNLQLLCPNCHALTKNFCGKNININKLLTGKPTNQKKIHEQYLLSRYGKNKLKPGEAFMLSQNDIDKRSAIILASNPKQYGWVMRVARQLGVSHACVRKFVNKYMPELIRKRRKSPKTALNY